MLDLEDQRLLVELSASGPCSLNHSPKKNWVEKSGGLPNYICHIAKAVAKGGHPTGGSIAIAIGTVKRWAAGGGTVNASTRAKASAAVAQWEALKARSHAHHTVKASETTRDMLTVSLGNTEDFNTSIVSNAWREYMDHCRMLRQAAEQDGGAWNGPKGWEYIKELWNNFVIAADGDGDAFWRVPYDVNGTDVDFGSWTEVQVQWADVPGTENDFDEDDLDDDEKSGIDDHLKSIGAGGLPFYDRPAPAEYSGW